MGSDPISFVPTPEPITRLMVSLISKNKNCQILDTGCGKGAFIQALLNENYDNITGIELNQKLYEYCNNQFKNLKLVNRDFLDWYPSSKFDLIIGNPPYLHMNSLPEKVQNKVEKIVGTRESDIYYAFIMKSIDLLKEGGELIYIVPYGFMYATHAKNLREKLLLNGYFEWIIDLDESRIFKNENPETLIFKFIKTKSNIIPKTNILRIKAKNFSVEEIGENAAIALLNHKTNQFFSFHKKRYRDTDLVWSTFPDKEIELYCKLSDIAYVGVGMVSGYSRSFKVNNGFKEKVSDIERELIVPFIKGANCKGYWTEGTQDYILISDNLKSEEKLRERYPKIYLRIVENKEEMKNRYLSKSKKWFNWQALRNYEDHKKYLNRKKIYVPTLDRSKKNRFSMTDEEVMPSGDVLAIVALKEDPYFLLGYLNSSFFREYYLSEGARRGHRISYTQKIMSNVKIPLFSDSVKKNIINITKKILKEKNKSYREEIDMIIENAFLEKDFVKTEDLTIQKEKNPKTEQKKLTQFF